MPISSSRSCAPRNTFARVGCAPPSSRKTTMSPKPCASLPAEATESSSKVAPSLAKGWNLIQRFSEDIDIFLDPEAFQPALGKNAIDRELKKLRDAVSEHPALTFIEGESQTIGGFGRNDR